MKTILKCMIAFIFVTCPLLAADSWPQFRGPTGDGHATGSEIPTTWSETEHVKWKTPIAGEGWSSPVCGGDQIWFTTATDGGKSLRAICVMKSSGKIAHDQEIFKVEKPGFKHALNSYASPTPVLAGDRVFVHFGTYGTACLDANSGAKIWEQINLKIDHGVGPGSSPVLYKDKLIVHCDGTDKQYVVALNTKDGSIAWKTDRSQVIDKVGDRKKAYSVPIIINVGGKDQCITPAAEYLYSYEPDTGKELWFIHYPGYSNVPRPVFANGTIFTATGFDRPEFWSVRAGDPAKGETGNLTKTHVGWKVTIQAPAQASPVLLGERVYMLSDTGTATCLDCKTGETKWKQQLGGEFSASPVLVNGRLYFFDRRGTGTVIETGDTFKVVAKNTLEEGCMASPAVIGKSLIVRTKKALYCIEK